ncbi:hypothetical protein RI367_004504 [Sorochytrium milnesiophthora]
MSVALTTAPLPASPQSVAYRCRLPRHILELLRTPAAGPLCMTFSPDGNALQIGSHSLSFSAPTPSQQPQHTYIAVATSQLGKEYTPCGSISYDIRFGRPKVIKSVAPSAAATAVSPPRANTQASARTQSRHPPHRTDHRPSQSARFKTQEGQEWWSHSHRRPYDAIAYDDATRARSAQPASQSPSVMSPASSAASDSPNPHLPTPASSSASSASMSPPRSVASDHPSSGPTAPAELAARASGPTMSRGLKRRMLQLLACKPLAVRDIVKRLNAKEDETQAVLDQIAQPLGNQLYELRPVFYKDVKIYDWTYDAHERRTVIDRARQAFTSLRLSASSPIWRILDAPAAPPAVAAAGEPTSVSNKDLRKSAASPSLPQNLPSPNLGARAPAAAKQSSVRSSSAKRVVSPSSQPASKTERSPVAQRKPALTTVNGRKSDEEGTVPTRGGSLERKRKQRDSDAAVHARRASIDLASDPQAIAAVAALKRRRNEPSKRPTIKRIEEAVIKSDDEVVGKPKVRRVTADRAASDAEIMSPSPSLAKAATAAARKDISVKRVRSSTAEEPKEVKRNKAAGAVPATSKLRAEADAGRSGKTLQPQQRGRTTIAKNLSATTVSSPSPEVAHRPARSRDAARPSSALSGRLDACYKEYMDLLGRVTSSQPEAVAAEFRNHNAEPSQSPSYQAGEQFMQWIGRLQQLRTELQILQKHVDDV